MKRILLFLSLLIVSTLVLPAQTTQGLSGTLVDPSNGAKFNGYLHIGLPNGTIKNTCTTPWVTVPKMNVTYSVVNGVIQGGSTSQFLPTPCYYPRLVYNVELDDSLHNFVYSDNWYFPSSTDTTVDVGTLQQENFGGPITVQVPKGIISNPNDSQVITQPTGTSLSLNGTIIINGVTFATAAGGVTYPGIVVTNPTGNQVVTQPGGTFLNLVGDINVNGQPISTSTGLTSFNTRTGPAIFPATGDYTCAQVTGCASSTTHYQTFQTNGSDVTAEPKANFSTDFTLTDTASTSTNIKLKTQTGLTAGSYTNSDVTVNAQGIITGITNGSAAGVNITPVDVTASRTFGTTFQNTSSHAMYVSGWGVTGGSSTGSIDCLIGPVSPNMHIYGMEYTATVSGGMAGFQFMVPGNYFYICGVIGTVSSTPGQWTESTF